MGSNLNWTLILASFFYFVGCHSGSSGSLFSDGPSTPSKQTPMCTTDACSKPPPDPEALTVQALNSNSTVLTPFQKKLDVGGYCNISTYAHGMLVVQILDAGTNTPAGGVNPTVVGTIRDPNFNDKVPRCVDGRFQFSAQVDHLPKSSNYKMKITLFAFDVEAKKVEAQLYSEFSFFKP